MTVEPATEQDTAAVVSLIVAQEARWHRLDPSLRPARTPQAIAAALAEQRQRQAEPPLVARDASGQVRGYVATRLREFSLDRQSDATLLEVFQPRTGFAEDLTLPSPEAEDVVPVATALLEAMQIRWQEQCALADVCRWPYLDAPVNRLLQSAGFEAFLLRAFRPADPLPPSPWPMPADLRVRQACHDDEDMLVALYLEESDYHHQHSPFFRMTPGLAADFRSLLADGWVGKLVEEGGPLVIVVEYAGGVVAMALTYLVRVDDLTHRDYLPLGRYANIAEVGVRAHLRGQGIGRALTQGVFDAYAGLQIDGYVLGFSPHNPLSSQFWPRLGFRPTWNLYQRRRHDTTFEV
jgi:GNAT superfamily N-acetyltransferase